MPRKEMQLRLRSKIVETREGHALTFGFNLGPLAIFVIANLPDVEPEAAHDSKFNRGGPLVYVKMDFQVANNWTEHSLENKRS